MEKKRRRREEEEEDEEEQRSVILKPKQPKSSTTFCATLLFSLPKSFPLRSSNPLAAEIVDFNCLQPKSPNADAQIVPNPAAPNRRISKGPQYVCTNFCTFICTTCSGIHREFTHRVKSISMAKFTSQEVTALQEGGNQHAKEIYFKELDPQRHSFPANSNVDRLRDFIKHVYVDRRYGGVTSSDNPPKGKMNVKEDFYETRKTDSYEGGSRSPPFEKTYDRPFSGKSSPVGRSPEFDQGSPQYSDYRSSPRTEVVNDWRRENRFGNEKKVESHNRDSKLQGRSPEQSKDLDPSSPPIARPVREILGESVIPLRIIEPPNSNINRTVAVSVQTQQTASSSSLGSVEGTKVENKVDVSRSLIDFDDVPEPPASSVPQPYQTIATQSVPQPVTSSNNNWASFDSVPEVKFSLGGSSESKLESVLSELSVSASVPGNSSGMHDINGSLTAAYVGNEMVLPNHDDSTFPSVGHTHTSPLGAGAPLTIPNSGLISKLPVSSANFFVDGVGAPLWPTMQIQQTSLFPSAAVQPMTEQFIPIVDGNLSNHAWNTSHAANSQRPPSYSAAQPPRDVTKPAQNVTSGVVSHPSVVEGISSGRKELPTDIFTATYSPYLAPVPGWHAGQPHAMNFNMPYNTIVPVQQFTQSAKSSNPFELKNEPHLVQSSSFPSMPFLQGALASGQPAMGLMRSASVDTPSLAWMSGQPSFYPASLPPQPSYPSSVPPNFYVSQQLASNIHTRPPGVGNFGNERAGYSNMDHQMVGRFSAPASPHPSSSASRNPFE